ncbi:MAG TPA: type III pantothenate kinase [Pyrinomonadaceae bacterium]|nr:type III pantothenate kinase [Pyrinomonadaceae bacterium]
MLLAVDIGNSATKFGVFEGERLLSKFSIHTIRDADVSLISEKIAGRLNQPFHSAIIASVVPELDAVMRDYLRDEHKTEPTFIDHGFDFGLRVTYEPLTSLGIDRLVNASAAATLYGMPCIVCSFGTATTIDAVSSDGEYLGGIIAPGMKVMAKALNLAAAKLPEVEIVKPANVLGDTTAASIRSGVYFGYVALVEGLIEKISKNLKLTQPDKATKGSTLYVVATGGYAETVAAEVSALNIVNTNLTLEGLRLLFERRVS